MTPLLRRSRELISDIFARHDRVFLPFSGGKDSIALAHLCEPWRGCFALVWVNTGYTFPHVEALIRQHGERFGLVELRSDLMARWREAGLPAGVLPVSTMFPDGKHDGPKLQTWPSCCAAARVQPLRRFAETSFGPTAFLHGQRHQDRAPFLGMSGWSLPSHVEVVAPLADWSTDDVMAFVEAEGLDLPSHYSEVPNSLDCWVCPAAFSEERGAQRAAYMAREHPDMLRAVLPGLKRIRDAAGGVVGRLDRIIRDVEPEPSIGGPIVLQRAPDAGDCMIAALATVIGWTYEDTASLLGFTVDPASGMALGVAGRGVQLAEVTAPLLSIGLSATVLLSSVYSSEGADTLRLPSSNELRQMIRGRPAVIQSTTTSHGRTVPHALAWTGHELFDCRGPEPRTASLDETDVLAAAVVQGLTTLSRHS